MGKKTKKILATLLAIAGVLTLYGCSTTKKVGYKVNLEVWGLFDDRDAYGEIFSNYSKTQQSIQQIEYKKLTVDTYKKELLEALASGQGPDIFLIHNTWLPMFKDKIVPAPPEILSQQKAKVNFVDGVADDFMADNLVYAVPLSVDSLNLYYNKDLLNEAGITAPPGNWNEFVQDTRKLTKIDNLGQVTQAGAALGTAYNINRSTDILGVLMLQRGTEMTDSGNLRATFDNTFSVDVPVGGANQESGLPPVNSPGENALEFYTQFAKTGSSVYAWNPNLHYSIDAFSEGKLAMMLNYSWTWDTVASKAPKLNFDVAPLPQLPGDHPVSYSNYWGFAVAKNKNLNASASANPQQAAVTNDIRIKEAWNFLTFLTTKPEQNISAATNTAGAPNGSGLDFDPAKTYLEKTKKPAARRDLIEAQKNDSKLGVFAEQNLIAKSWYQSDAEAIEAVLAEMIDQVNRGQFTSGEAIKSAAAKVSQLMGNKF
ncbi:MAG: extracellular solute-binding protein [Patescibacteria group bacterium]